MPRVLENIVAHHEQTAVTEWDVECTKPETRAMHEDHTAVDPEVSHTAERTSSWMSSTEQLPTRARLLQMRR